LNGVKRQSLNNKSIIAVFGSEGGISENEISILTKSEFKMVSLGKRILRAETAPLYLISCLQSSPTSNCYQKKYFFFVGESYGSIS